MLFYRKLPLTIEYLKGMSHYKTYDFVMNVAVGKGTAYNTFPLFSNYLYHPCESIRGEKIEGDATGPNSIIKILKNHSFITMLGTDKCTSSIARGLGQKPAVHHIVTRFFCYAKRIGAIDG